MQPLITRTIGKTTYADMRLMEAHLRQSSLDWTVVRPGGLFDATETTAYELAQNRSERVFTSRADLAAALLELGTTRDWIGSFVAVNTTTGAPTVAQGNVEMARVIVTGTLLHDFAGVAGAGRSFRMDQAVICHLDGGKVAEAWEIADVGALVGQVSS